MNVASKLHAYLTRAAGMEFAWATHDCCTFPAGWVVENGHADPMERWAYSDGDGASALVARHGLLDMWFLSMIEAGMPEADEPRIGDIGVVECASCDGVGQVGAIYGGKRWHALGETGLFQASMRPLMVWRVCDG